MRRSVAGTSIPTARLKRGFRPTICDRRPAAVSRSQRPNSATSARLMTKPRCSVVGGKRRGSSASARNRQRRRIGGAAREQGSVDEPARDVDSDEVQHQGRHHFIDAEARARQRRPDQPDAADDRGRSERDRNQQHRGPAGHDVPENRGDQSAEVEAAFGADVEDSGAKRDRRREARQQQRGRRRQGSRDASLSAKGFLDHQTVDRERIMPRRRQDSGADAGGERERRRGGGDSPSWGCERREHYAAFWPSIMRPTFSTLASPRPSSPTTTPP